MQEYWIADTESRTIEVLVLEGNEYTSRGVYIGEGTLPSSVVPEIATIRVKQFFATK